MGALGSVHRHVIEVDDSGTPVTGLVTLDFTLTLQREAAGTLVSDAASVTVTEIDGSGLPGFYWVDYTPATAAALHRLEIAATGGYSVTPAVFEDIVTGAVGATGADLTTRDNLKLALKIAGSADDARIDAAIAAVSAFVRDYCGRQFTQATYTEKLDGGDVAGLTLAEYPVSSITTVHESTASPRVYNASTLVAASAYLVEAARGILWRTDGLSWSAGPQTVQVVYVGGYSTVPADLERAVIETAQVKLAKGKGQSYHVSSENRGDGAVSYVATVRWDDVPMHAREIFERYRARRAI